MARALVVGNWKSYVTSRTDARVLFSALQKKVPQQTKCEVVVCPPTPFIAPLSDAYRGVRIAFGAQDAHFETGAATGTVAALALKSLGVKYVILGHAERRAMGETDDIVSKKVGAALDAKLIPIVCVGERSRDRDGHYLKELEASIAASLKTVQPHDLKRLVIAYEPVWAIGAPLAPNARTVRESVIFIRKVLADLLGREGALKTRIIYGGAVDGENARELTESGASGFLVGRASIDPQAFGAIVSVFQ